MSSEDVPSGGLGWKQGPAQCVSCGYNWQAVVPLVSSEGKLECPNCHEVQGRMLDVGLDLSDVSNKDLFKELSKRFSGLVIGHMRNLREEGELVEEFNYHYSGGQCQALGIIEKVRSRIMRQSIEEDEE